jgi:hypothetical protein
MAVEAKSCKDYTNYTDDKLLGMGYSASDIYKLRNHKNVPNWDAAQCVDNNMNTSSAFTPYATDGKYGRYHQWRKTPTSKKVPTQVPAAPIPTEPVQTAVSDNVRMLNAVTNALATGGLPHGVHFELSWAMSHLSKLVAAADKTKKKKKKSAKAPHTGDHLASLLMPALRERCKAAGHAVTGKTRKAELLRLLSQ